MNEPLLWRCRSRPADPPDVTLINLNLMLVRDDKAVDRQRYVPLGLLYIAAYLERHGYNVEFADYQTYSGALWFESDTFIECLQQPAPVIGISCMSNLLPFAIHLAEKLKMANPASRIVLGGSGPSPVAAEIIAAFPFIDSVVVGEGEFAMLAIMRGCMDRVLPRQIPVDLDSLPMPAYSLLNPALYDAAPSIITSRGCPYSCSFCTEPHNFGGIVRFRSIDRVLEEIELVHALSGRNLFLFQDDILPLRPQRFRELLAGFRQLSFPIRWKCFSRVDLMTESLMEEMAQSGCVQIRYGVESGSNDTLTRIRKGFTVERAYETAVKSLKYFPSVHASFIWGYPFEELPAFEETLWWLERFEMAGVSVLLFEYAPLPGSQLCRENRDGLSFSPDRYSFFVVTGHETVRKNGYALWPEFNSLYQIVREHPDVFSGFYHHENLNLLTLRQRLERYKLNRRTPVKNQYDL